MNESESSLELEFIEQHVRLAEALLRLRKLQRVYDLLYGEGSYQEAMRHLQAQVNTLANASPDSQP